MLSVGDLVDRATIAEIKAEKIPEPHFKEYAKYLRELLPEAVYAKEAAHLYERLLQLNEALWELEDEIRGNHLSDAEVAELARSIIDTNDLRTVTKKKIDLMFGQTSVEEKKYAK